MARLIILVIFFSKESINPSLNINEGKMPNIAIITTISTMQKELIISAKEKIFVAGNLEAKM
jgi:hypothetical protein